MKKFVLGTMTIALLGMFSCRREPAENIKDIWKKYTVSYNAESMDLNVTAVFRIENSFGTKLKLDDNSSISYGSIDLTWRPTWAYYSLNQSSFVSDGAFVWRQGNGTTSEVPLPLVSAALPSYIDTLTNNSPFDLPFSGESLAAGEKITVYFTDRVGGTRSFEQTTTGTNYIPIDITTFNDLEIGNITVYFEREKEGTFTDVSSGGEYEVKYTGQTETIYLKD